MKHVPRWKILVKRLMDKVEDGNIVLHTDRARRSVATIWA